MDVLLSYDFLHTNLYWHMPAGILCPEPTHWTLLSSLFPFKSRVSYQTAALCDDSPSANSTPQTSNKTSWNSFLHSSPLFPHVLCQPRLSFLMVSGCVQSIRILKYGGQSGQTMPSSVPLSFGFSSLAFLPVCSSHRMAQLHRPSCPGSPWTLLPPRLLK